MSEDNILAELLNKEGTSITNKEINVRTSIKDPYTKKRPVFSHCTFSQDLIFSGKAENKLDINHGLKFVNCTFNKVLKLEYLRDSFSKSPGGIRRTVIFEDCTITNLQIHGCEFSKGLILCKNSEIHNWNIQHLEISNGDFSVEDCRIVQSHNNVSNQIEATNVINSLKSSKLLFKSIECKANISINKLHVENFEIADSSFSKEIDFKVMDVQKEFLLKSSNFNLFELNMIDVEKPDDKGFIENFKLLSSEFDDSFTINGYSTGILNKIDITFSNRVKGALQFNSCCINGMNLKGDNFSSVVVINCDIDSLKFDYLYNYANISLVDIRPKEAFSIIEFGNSDLGKTKLFNIDLDSFSEIVIYQCILSEVVTSSVTWFSDEILSTRYADLKKNYVHRREIYRQLKQSLTNQSDKISSLRFKALEKKYYKKELLHNIPKWKKLFDKDRFILIVNESNDYGLNWARPAEYALYTIVGFYILMFPGLSPKLVYCPCFELDCICLTLKEFCRYSGLMPQFINPVHNLHRIVPPDVNHIGFGVYFLDALLKIFIAYFIFQTVSAFRKHLER